MAHCRRRYFSPHRAPATSVRGDKWRDTLRPLVGREPAALPQGTVKSYDPITNEAVILDDQLNELVVDREVFAASGLRELRLGQRVRFELDEEDDAPQVTNLNIVSL